jgi:uncharacterized protein (DUF488 family)
VLTSPSSLVLTVGHSSRELDEFLEVLRAHDVDHVADVRRFPGSRRHPHFHAEALAASLHAAGIGYTHFRELGGRRTSAPDSPNLGLRNAGFRGYADHMRTSAFTGALEALLVLARARRVAAMCAEAHPAQCHRRLLSDALIARGARVEHILAAGERFPHALTAGARVESGRVTYPPASGARGMGTLFAL